MTTSMEYRNGRSGSYSVSAITETGETAAWAAWEEFAEEEIIDDSGEIEKEKEEYILINTIHTAENFRRQGLGRAVLRAALKKIKADFPDLPIRLVVMPDDEDIISYADLTAFYESEDFVVISADDDIVMEKV